MERLIENTGHASTYITEQQLEKLQIGSNAQCSVDAVQQTADVKLNKGSVRRIYHGTTASDLKPCFGGGMNYHDYGNGLYCTEDLESAKEWACQHADTSVAYVYPLDLDMSGLQPVLDLNEREPVFWRQ